MKNIIKGHKKLTISFIVLISLFLVFFIVIFVLPLFKSNNYGDRLDGIEKHKVSTKKVADIKDTILEKKGVDSVSYQKEGRILNFIIILNEQIDLAEAKTYVNEITEKLDSEINKYYDIEVFIDTKEESKIYPVIGYHSKKGKEFTWSNVGESNE